MKKNEIKKYLLENGETLLNIVDELNYLNGCLEDLTFFENNEEFFNSNYFDYSPMEIVKIIYYGEYDYNDKYIKYDEHGNIKSFSEYELIEDIKNSIDNIVDCLVQYYGGIEIYDENLEKILLEE